MNRIKFETQNPYSGKMIASYEYASDQEIETCLDQAFFAWQKDQPLRFSDRARLLIRLAQALRQDSHKLAQMMALEMGKPVRQGALEISKCADCCQYLAEHAEAWLQPIQLSAQYRETWVMKQSLGPVLAIMPWNYPAWQVIRVLAPQILIGNPVVLKHSDLVAGFAQAFTQTVNQALEEGSKAFQNLHFSHAQTERVIADPRIRAVSFTGSVLGGAKIGGYTGAFLKKSVLELGGSDPYIVFEDADLGLAARILAKARLVNNGQSCVAAKRFIVAAKIKDQLVEKIIEQFKAVPAGNPLHEGTLRGPLAAKKFQLELLKKVEQFKSAGARTLWSEETHKNYQTSAEFAIELLECPARFSLLKDQEFFGPVACLQSFDSEAEALRLANATDFALGAAVFSKDLEKAKKLSLMIEAGMIAINEQVISDVRTPFGGLKCSGYGRELGETGVHEFVCWKTVGIS